jgi:HEPN domain-containing protein
MEKDLVLQRFIENERNIRDLQDDVEKLYMNDRYDDFHDSITDSKKEMVAIIDGYERDLRHLVKEMQKRIDALEDVVKEYMKV